MLKSKLAMSFEAVAFQVNPTLFTEIALIFGELRKLANPTTKDIQKTNLTKLLKSELNLNINPQIDPATYPNAYVMPPALNKNHPLVTEWFRHAKGDADALAGISANGGMFFGTVNLNTGRIDGPIANVECDLWVTVGLLQNKIFTDQEIAAIFLHEIGHIEVYFEFVCHAVSTNYILAELSRAWSKSDSQVKRIQLIRDAQKAMKIAELDPEKLAEENKVDVVQTVLLSKSIDATRTELGSQIYDMRAWEQLSDQFATRFGAGRDLATALDKIMRWSGHESYRGTAMFVVIEAIKFIAWLGMMFIGLIPLAALILLYNPNVKIYDEPGERIQRIRQQLILRLKDNTLSKDYRQSLLDDVECLDQIVEPINDRRGILELFWTAVIPGGRYEYNQQKFQQELEALALNDLFLQSAKLKALK